MKCKCIHTCILIACVESCGRFIKLPSALLFRNVNLEPWRKVLQFYKQNLISIHRRSEGKLGYPISTSVISHWFATHMVYVSLRRCTLNDQKYVEHLMLVEHLIPKSWALIWSGNARASGCSRHHLGTLQHPPRGFCCQGNAWQLERRFVHYSENC